MNHCGKGFERAREVIRGHARLLFIRNGYEKTTMQQVAVLETAVRHRPADESIATTALLSVLDVWKAQTKQLETDTNVGDPGIADELVRVKLSGQRRCEGTPRRPLIYIILKTRLFGRFRLRTPGCRTATLTAISPDPRIGQSARNVQRRAWHTTSDGCSAEADRGKPMLTWVCPGRLVMASCPPCA